MELLGKYNFFLLIAGRLIAGLSSSIFSFALSLYVLDLTGSATVFSAVLSFSIIPGVLVNLFAGALVDRFNKKRSIVISDLLSCLIMGFFALCFWKNPSSIPVIIIFTSVMSIIQSYYGLAMTTSIPNIVNTSQVARANSFIQILTTLMAIIGPVLGAIIYKSFGMQMIIEIEVFAYFASAAMAILMVFHHSEISAAAEFSYIGDIKVAFKYLYNNQALRFLLFICVIMNTIYVPMVMLVMPYINYQVIKVSGFQLSLIEAAWGIGGTLGGIYISVLKDSRHIIRKLFLLLSAQAFLLLLWIFPAISYAVPISKTTITFVFCTLLALTGMLNMIQNIPIFTYFQLEIPENVRGKVLGFINVAAMVSTPIGMWIFGLLLGVFNWYYITIVSALMMMGICFISSQNRNFIKFATGLNLKEELTYGN